MSTCFSGSPPSLQLYMLLHCTLFGFCDGANKIRLIDKEITEIAVLFYKVLYGLAPHCLDHFTHVADLPGRLALRFAGSSLCAYHMSDCPLSTAGPSRSLDLKSGTIYQNM